MDSWCSVSPSLSRALFQNLCELVATRTDSAASERMKLVVCEFMRLDVNLTFPFNADARRGISPGLPLTVCVGFGPPKFIYFFNLVWPHVIEFNWTVFVEGNYLFYLVESSGLLQRFYKHPPWINGNTSGNAPQLSSQSSALDLTYRVHSPLPVPPLLTLLSSIY